MYVLIVDDSQAIRILVKRIMRDLGFEQSAQAGNGEEALACLAAGPVPDLAMVDWNMPVMDGLAFVQAVRANEAYSRMRIVMVTTETEMSQVARALEAGADEYIMKPFTADIVRDKLELLQLTGA